MGPRPDDPELLDQFDGNLEDADASASQVYASDSISQFSHMSFCRMSRVQRPTLHLLALVHRKPAKSGGKGKNGKEERRDFSVQWWMVSLPWYTWSLAKNCPHAPNLFLRCARSRQKPAQLVVDHITLLGFHPVSPSLASCIRMSQQRRGDLLVT